jgi:uncharacterized protein
MNPEYIYLHGFASSPQSGKAQYLRDRFLTEVGIKLNILDLNWGNFTNLSLTRQIQQTVAAFPSQDRPVILIGSSFGGLTATWVANKYPQVTSLVLLAPAFGFPASWRSRLGEVQLKQWQESNYLSVYHYGENRYLPLNYQFLLDAGGYDETELNRNLPTLILHGQHDDVIPIEVSRTYASQHSSVKLIELDSDHGLNDVKEIIWQEIRSFLNFI